MKFLVALVGLVLATQVLAQRQCYVCENCRTLPNDIVRTTCADTIVTTTTVLPTTTDGEPTTTGGPIPPPPPFPPPARQRRATQDPWQCFEIERRVGDFDIHNRGCVQRTAVDANTCAAANGGVNPQWCRLCDSDGCNSASSTSLSLTIFLTSIMLAIKLF